MTLFERGLTRVLAEVFGTQVRAPEREAAGAEAAGAEAAGAEAAEAEAAEAEAEGPDDYIPGGGYDSKVPGAYNVDGQICPECGQMRPPQQMERDYECPECGIPCPGSEEAVYGPVPEDYTGSGYENVDLADEYFGQDYPEVEGGWDEGEDEPMPDYLERMEQYGR